MEKGKKQTRGKGNRKVDKHAVENIPSKQDRPWVGASQMEQTQFDEAEYEKKNKEKNK